MIKLTNTQHIIHGRIVIGAVIMITMTLLIIWQYAHLTINQSQHFSQLSNNNFNKGTPIIPPRGSIYDRNMHVLAKDEYSHYIVITKDDTRPFSVIKNDLSAIIQTQWKSLEKEYNDAAQGAEITLPQSLSKEQYTQLALNMWSLPHMHFNETMNRTYPFGASSAHMTGYTHKSEQHIVGKNGIELTFNEHLSGELGWMKMTKNARGKVQNQSEIIPAIPGMDVQLTIDAPLQQAVHNIMSKYQGTAILVSTRTSEILAAVSLPSFDPNHPFEKTNTAHSFYNRVTHGLYPPASTVKPFIALEALHQNIINTDTTIQDPGYYITPNGSHRYNDWLKHGHGTVDIHKAIAISCDTFFYHLAEKMGAYQLSHAMSQFGLGQKTFIELPNEKSGLVPSPSWKSMLGQKWYLGDSINTGIGQGATQVTPIQLAQATVLLANQGQGKKIHLTKALMDQGQWHVPSIDDAPPVQFDKKTWDVVNHALIDVVRSGTGHRFKKNPHHVAGKTGTAQVVSMKNQTDNNTNSHDHSLFIGYAPFENPEVAIVVVLEHNPLAVAAANDIINVYFKNDANHESKSNQKRPL
ncbi:penicillin-binding protein 2 [Gammaproteobacteria bacterium]|nr:penicillin-binding protein 2 [Gammaproteobacteria bacterium]